MPMFRKPLLILVLLAILAAGAAAWQLTSSPQAQQLDAGTAPVETKRLSVHVAGAVQRPGVVTLAAGARAQDAIEACGGFLPNADTKGINLAQPLKDGTQLRVPEMVEQRNLTQQGNQSGNGTAGGRQQDTTVNINTADLQALQQLHGIGPALAQRIIDYRTEHGAFRTPEELTKVKGIGAGKLEKMLAQIRL